MSRYPKRCPECGGKVRARTRIGRTMPYKNMPALLLPKGLKIPTCDTCGEQFVDDKLSDELDDALARRYAEEVMERAVKALEVLAHTVPKQQLEILLGLSQGYLSKIQAKTTSPMLANLLMLIADDPRKNIEKLQAKWKTLEEDLHQES